MKRYLHILLIFFLSVLPFAVIPASSYDPANGDYFKGTRSAYEGIVWTMYIDYGYWDCYYQFKKVAE